MIYFYTKHKLTVDVSCSETYKYTLFLRVFQLKYNVHKEKKNNRKYNGNYIHANKQKQQQQIWLYHHKKSTSNVGGFPLRHWFIDCFGIFPRDSISCHEYQLVWELRFALRQYLTLAQLRINFWCVCVCVCFVSEILRFLIELRKCILVVRT